MTQQEAQNAENVKIATAALHCLRQLKGELTVPSHPVRKPEPAKRRRGNPDFKPFEIPEALAAECSTLGCIEFRLPPPHAEAGRVLRHAIGVLETLFRQQEPLIFKIGVTHDPVWRWSNHLYGYCRDVDSWRQMVIFYGSTESAGPGMLEASLIDKYRCC